MGCLKLAYRTDYTALKVVYRKYTSSENSCTGAYRYGVNGQMRDDEVIGSGNTYTAEFWEYDARLGRRWNVDPLFAKEPWMAPYHAYADNPLLNVDPSGAGESPIYDQEGNLQGTDDQGLQGAAIVMDKKDFTQGMKHDDAVKKGIGIDGMSPKAMSKLTESFTSLPSRPDYDDKLTLNEANEWYKNNSGKPLYVDLGKIDFSTTYKSDVNFDAKGNTGYVNLFLTQSPMSEMMDGGGNVYGSVKLQIASDLTVTAPKNYHDRYDFDPKPWTWNPSRWARNLGTDVGEWKAGKGASFDIFFYGKNQLSTPMPPR